MPSIAIDGVRLEVSERTTILEAAREAGIRIPTLCYLKDVSAIGSCRVCVVEVEGEEHPVPSCTTVARDGMVVTTSSPKLASYRRTALDLILSEHGLDSTRYCFSCVKNGACELADLCREYGVVEPSARVERKREPVLDSNPFLVYDPNLCIACQRCVGACNNAARNHTLRAGKRAARTVIEAPFGENWRDTTCESCGNCAAACPTGALSAKRRAGYRVWETERVRTTCPHCGVGCQLNLVVKDGRIVDAEAAPGPANKSLLCVKGRFASYDFVGSPERLRTPLVKNPETGEFEPATWDEALDLVASRFADLKERYGGEALAAFACARSTNEDIYLLQKMARTAFGTNNVDNCARVCHAPSVSGLAATLGSGAMTNTIEDVTREADVIMLVGSNPEEAHPVFGMQIRAAVENGAKLIVVDPRDIRLTERADVHLKLRPGTNVAFANGMVHILINEGLVDREFIEERTEGFDRLARMVQEYTPERVAEICGIDARDLVSAAKLYGSAERAPIIYCLGVTEHSSGTEGVMSLSNIAMVCGKLGRPGCGVNPVRGQNNVQGACDMGATPGDFPGYQKLTNPEVAEKFERAWSTELSRVPGLMATECFPAMVDGRIKGLFVFGEDPVRTDPDTGHVIKALEALDFLVVDDLFMTETARYADVILPGRSYAEKEGTFTNTERRVQRVRKAVDIGGDTLLDTDIFTEIMNRMGYPQPHLSAAQIMDEIASLTPSYGGISHARLDGTEVAGQGLQWPCPNRDHPGTAILHVGSFSRGIGAYSTAEYREATEQPDGDYPFILMTGRILYQYNACAMTGRAEGINEVAPSSFIEMNERDASALGIADGDRVKVASRRGEVETTARVSDKTSPGETWMPFHFQDGNSNWLTIAALDTIAKTPEYKVCAVRVERAKTS
ncbi:formate dehydrogenase subunit alpha [Raoultibacter timonensis]|uniref:formate dehydrogenase subunit alpha n=1 Tax=Raoultibacter timonensis TaxID=1907662 RepID=UPI000C85A1D8|nr:formate dehydrogenase subunit alpha [Raoultibacter timonensis]